MTLVDLDLSPIVDHWPDLLDGFRLTVLIGLVAWCLACLVGIAATAVRAGGNRTGVTLVKVYVELMRGMPSLVLILACYYLLPQTGLHLDALQSGLAALTLYYGAYFSEAMRGALASVPAGQREAAVTTGLPPIAILCRVVLPQALGPMLPPLTGLTIGLVKETALLSTISVHELVFAGKEAISESYAPFEIYGAIALCYWGLSAAIAAAAGPLEARTLAYRSSRQPALRA